MNTNIGSRTIWPGFIKPLDDELFSSWLIRLSEEHLIKSYSFSKIYFNNQPIWNRDIDKLQPKTIVDSLKKHSPLSYSEINNLFLNSYTNYLFSGSINDAHTRGILNLGIFHRKRLNFGLLACPLCLSEGLPYFKKQWRLSTSLVCVKCKCELIDRCEKCKKPIAFHRLELENKALLRTKKLYFCWNCNFDLRKNITRVDIASKIYKYQKYIDKTLLLGYNNITNYSFTYFYVILNILSMLSTNSKEWNRLQIALNEEYDNTFINHLNTTAKYENSILIRKKALLMAHRLLDKWPNEFIRVKLKYKIRYSDFSKDMKKMPYWLFAVLKSN